MYIYKTTNLVNGKIYIGLSTKNVNVSKNYYGSGINLHKSINKYGKCNFNKTILEDSIIDYNILCKREIFFIDKLNACDPNIGYNIKPGGELGTPGLVAVIDIESQEKLFVTIEEYRLNSNYQTHTKNKVVVTNIATNKLTRIGVNEYRQNQHKYIHFYKNKVTAIDTRDNSFCCVNVDEFKDKSYLVGVTKGKLKVIDVETQDTLFVTIDEFKHNSNLFGLNLGKVIAKNKITNEIVLISQEEFKSNDDLVGIVYGKIAARNKITNEQSMIERDIYEQNKHIYEAVNLNMVSVFDNQLNKQVFIDKSIFRANKSRYTHPNKNYIHMWNPSTNKKERILKSEIYKYPNLIKFDFSARNKNISISRCKLTKQQVIDIWQLNHNRITQKYTHISKKFNVTPETISALIRKPNITYKKYLQEEGLI